ncbi:MAG: hypothetical protein ACK5M3_05605 [Dysgonomonas sp.]
MNGFIQAQIQTSGGENEYGEPIPANIDWDEKKECKYYANTLNGRGRYEDGKFTQSAYIITVFDMDFSATVVRLFNSKGKLVVEKEVQSLEELEEVQRVKVTI